eukprot:jgi/Botrbrau1/2474/Bobra.0226s0032.1
MSSEFHPYLHRKILTTKLECALENTGTAVLNKACEHLTKESADDTELGLADPRSPVCYSGDKLAEHLDNLFGSCNGSIPFVTIGVVSSRLGQLCLISPGNALQPGESCTLINTTPSLLRRCATDGFRCTTREDLRNRKYDVHNAKHISTTTDARVIVSVPVMPCEEAQPHAMTVDKSLPVGLITFAWRDLSPNALPRVVEVMKLLAAAAAPRFLDLSSELVANMSMFFPSVWEDSPSQQKLEVRTRWFAPEGPPDPSSGGGMIQACLVVGSPVGLPHDDVLDCAPGTPRQQGEKPALKGFLMDSPGIEPVISQLATPPANHDLAPSSNSGSLEDAVHEEQKCEKSVDALLDPKQSKLWLKYDDLVLEHHYVVHQNQQGSLVDAVFVVATLAGLGLQHLGEATLAAHMSQLSVTTCIAVTILFFWVLIIAVFPKWYNEHREHMIIVCNLSLCFLTCRLRWCCLHSNDTIAKRFHTTQRHLLLQIALEILIFVALKIRFWTGTVRSLPRLVLAGWMNYFIIKEGIGPSRVFMWLMMHSLLRAVVMAMTAFVLRGYEATDRKICVDQTRRVVAVRYRRSRARE